MSYDTNPYADSPEQPLPPKNNGKIIIYTILVTVLVASWAYIIYDWMVIHKNQDDQIAKAQGQYLSADSSRSAIQTEYNGALSKMDSLTNSNTQLTGELAVRKKQIDKLKSQIRAELDKEDPDLAETRKLVDQLKLQITDLLAQIDQLKQQNQRLMAANNQLTNEADTLKVQKQVVEQNLATTTAVKTRLEDIASTLRTSGVSIVPLMNVANGMAVEQRKARKVDLLRIFFQIDPNSLASTGSKDLYLCVTGADGKPVTMPGNVSGTFTTRDEGDKIYTKKQKIQYTQGRVYQTSIDWKLGKGNYKRGNYTMQIYNNGFKICEAVTKLK